MRLDKSNSDVTKISVVQQFQTFSRPFFPLTKGSTWRGCSYCRVAVCACKTSCNMSMRSQRVKVAMCACLCALLEKMQYFVQICLPNFPGEVFLFQCLPYFIIQHLLQLWRDIFRCVVGETSTQHKPNAVDILVSCNINNWQRWPKFAISRAVVNQKNLGQVKSVFKRIWDMCVLSNLFLLFFEGKKT